MIKEFDKVQIKKTWERGTVVDIRGDDKKIYMVEKDTDNELVDCAETEIEAIK